MPLCMNIHLLLLWLILKVVIFDSTSNNANALCIYSNFLFLHKQTIFSFKTKIRIFIKSRIITPEEDKLKMWGMDFYCKIKKLVKIHIIKIHIAVWVR